MISPEWQETIAQITSNPGVVMVIGAADTGKTHFCLQLCNAALEAGIKVAAVDADVGQSEVGAPGTIGMALVDKPVEALSDLKPRRLYFIGATSPVRHMLECAVGAGKMVDQAHKHGAQMVVLDTTGLVDGSLGRKLKTYKADLIRPDYLVGIQRRREIEHLLAPFAKLATVNVRKVSSSDQARRKPTEFRTARRRLNFYNHFHDSGGHIIHLDEVSLWNTFLRTGRPMKWQYMKFAEDALKCRVLHAEVTGAGIFIITETVCRSEGVRALEEEFKTRNITLVAGTSYENLLVGLADENAAVINVALLQAIDFKQRFMSVVSPIKTVSPVRIVQFGSIRVTKEGEQLATLRTGEI